MYKQGVALVGGADNPSELTVERETKKIENKPQQEFKNPLISLIIYQRKQAILKIK